MEFGFLGGFFDQLRNQTFDWPDLAVIGLLILLEGVLSIDNALVLGLLAKRLPRHQRGKALSYGMSQYLVGYHHDSTLSRLSVARLSARTRNSPNC